MKTRFRSSLLAVGLGSVLSILSPAQASVIYNGGGPNQYTIYFADTSYSYNQDAVSYFLLADMNTVTDVHWWGGCSSSTGHCPTANFTLDFYVDNAGTPGSLLDSYSVGNANQVATGALILGYITEYSYTANIPATTFTAGTSYFLGVSNTTANAGWGMETTGTPGAGSHEQYLKGNGWTTQPDNLAFNLTNDGLNNGNTNNIAEPGTLMIVGLGVIGTLLARRLRTVQPR